MTEERKLVITWATIVLLTLALGFCLGAKFMECMMIEEAIERGAASYNSETGKLIWKGERGKP
jgi:hypothetical protein